MLHHIFLLRLRDLDSRRWQPTVLEGEGYVNGWKFPHVDRTLIQIRATLMPGTNLAETWVIGEAASPLFFSAYWLLR
jgi:hypothetical protein